MLDVDHSQRSRRQVGLSMMTCVVACLFMSGCQNEAADTPSNGAVAVRDAGDTENPPVPSSHARMVEDIRRIAEWSRADHPILGNGNATTLRARMGPSRLPDGTIRIR